MPPHPREESGVVMFCDFFIRPLPTLVRAAFHAARLIPRRACGRLPGRKRAKFPRPEPGWRDDPIEKSKSITRPLQGEREAGRLHWSKSITTPFQW